MQKNKKVLIIAAVVLILIAAALFFIEGSKKPVPIEGAKTITVTVMQEGVENKVFTIHTDAEFLRGALEQENSLRALSPSMVSMSPPWMALPPMTASVSTGALRMATAMTLLSVLILPPLPMATPSRSYLPPIKPAA